MTDYYAATFEQLIKAQERINQLEGGLKLIMAGGSHSEGMQWREHDLNQVRTIAAATLSGDCKVSREES